MAIEIGQSADPDDAFMSWALATGRVRVGGVRPRLRFADIQTLNEWALEARLDATALSAAAYPAVARRYRLLRCGASFGRGYGPVVAGRQPPRRPGPEALAGLRVATPGAMTTAHLLLRVYAGDSFEAVPMPFDRILGAVADGSVDAGLLIHEGQLTYAARGLHALFEPARAWHDAVGLPLPLGVMAVRRNLGPSAAEEVAAAFRASIEHGLHHRDEALAFAARYGRGLERDRLELFVAQYVDESTRDMGAEGVAALERLYRLARDAGLLEEAPPLDPL